MHEFAIHADDHRSQEGNEPSKVCNTLEEAVEWCRANPPETGCASDAECPGRHVIFGPNGFKMTARTTRFNVVYFI